MSSSDRRLAELLVLIAADLEGRGYEGVGALRQAARRLLELAALAPDEPVCPCGCGRPVPPPSGRGRPRTYASQACRRRAEKRRRNARVAA